MDSSLDKGHKKTRDIETQFCILYGLKTTSLVISILNYENLSKCMHLLFILNEEGELLSNFIIVIENI